MPSIAEIYESGSTLFEDAGLPDILRDAHGRAAEYRRRAISETTLKSYADDWQRLRRSAQTLGIRAFPLVPDNAAAILTTLSDEGYSAGTIRRARNFMKVMAHRMGTADPCDSKIVDQTFRGIMRTYHERVGTLTPFQKDAFVWEDLERGLARLDVGEPSLARRTQIYAFVLLLFASAMRVSEQIALDVKRDLRFTSEQLWITIQSSKSSPLTPETIAVGRTGTATCPVAALENWLAFAGIVEGALWRRVDRWSNIYEANFTTTTALRWVKIVAELAGIDASKISCHSLRAGFVTTMANGGASADEISQQTRHKSNESLRHYYRPRSKDRPNFSKAMGM